MPDLITHFSAAYFIKIPRHWSRFRIPFFLGAILPDLLCRPFMIVYPKSASFVYGFHSPLVLVIISLLIAQFFSGEIRPRVRINLLLGVGLHLVLDLFQRQVIVAYYWFFPFSWKTFDLGLFWPEDSLRLVPLWLSLMLIIEVTLLVKKRVKKHKRQ